MYTEGAQVTGHYRFLQHNSKAFPCACHRCVHLEQPYTHHGGLQAARQTDHPALDDRRDSQDPWVKDLGRTEYVGNQVERTGHRSPQRRPVFVGPGPCNRSDDLSPVCPWELNPAQWNYPVRHCPPVREQCGCVVRNETRVYPFSSGIPHPLPHLQVKGQGCRPRRTVRYVSVDEEDYNSEGYHFEPPSPTLGHLPNGHCGPGPSLFEGGEERDIHQDWGRAKGGSEHGCNGHGSFYKGFFSTEVPPKHLNPSRRKGSCIPPSDGTQTSKSNGLVRADQQQDPEVLDPKRKQDSVREQIRQVVTNLEDVLGGLKQVHVEMKEVVEQIDRLTANIDLSEEAPGITQGSSNNNNNPDQPEVLRLAPVNNHRLGQVQMPQHIDEDRIMLRTNSPSPVHMASVVKTNRILPSGYNKDIKHRLNGHPPQLRPMNHTGHPPPELHPQALDPKVIIENRTQKPPPYPQNGRCGKYPPPKPAKTPSHTGRGRQSSSVV